MKGTILDFEFENRSGVISGDDGNRYSFKSGDWKGQSRPKAGMRVDFEVVGTHATGIYSLAREYRTHQPTPAGGKDKTAAGLLAIFLGSFGIHKFYLGYTGPGLVYLLVNTIGWFLLWIVLYIPNIILGVIALVEGIIYLTQTDEEFHETYVKGRKDWF